MANFKGVTPYLYYDDSSFEGAEKLRPVRSSHIYIDLPGDPVEFHHFRTDIHGKLCNVADETSEAKATAPAWISNMEKRAFRIYHDNGLLDDAGRKALAKGRGTTAAKLQHRIVKNRRGVGRNEFYFKLPRGPFKFKIDKLTVRFNGFTGGTPYTGPVEPLPPADTRRPFDWEKTRKEIHERKIAKLNQALASNAADQSMPKWERSARNRDIKEEREKRQKKLEKMEKRIAKLKKEADRIKNRPPDPDYAEVTIGELHFEGFPQAHPEFRIDWSPNLPPSGDPAVPNPFHVVGKMIGVGGSGKPSREDYLMRLFARAVMSFIAERLPMNLDSRVHAQLPRHYASITVDAFDQDGGNLWWNSDYAPYKKSFAGFVPSVLGDGPHLDPKSWNQELFHFWFATDATKLKAHFPADADRGNRQRYVDGVKSVGGTIFHPSNPAGNRQYTLTIAQADKVSIHNGFLRLLEGFIWATSDSISDMVTHEMRWSW